MANDLYRGYEIVPHGNGGFYWTDERGFDHTGSMNGICGPRDQYTGCYPTADKAMDAIDAYRRALAAA